MLLPSTDHSVNCFIGLLQPLMKSKKRSELWNAISALQKEIFCQTPLFFSGTKKRSEETAAYKHPFAGIATLLGSTKRNQLIMPKSSGKARQKDFKVRSTHIVDGMFFIYDLPPSQALGILSWSRGFPKGILSESRMENQKTHLNVKPQEPAINNVHNVFTAYRGSLHCLLNKWV